MRRCPCLLLFLALTAPLCALGAELSGVLRDNHGNGLGGIALTADMHVATTTTQCVDTPTPCAVMITTQCVAITDATGAFKFPGDFNSATVQASTDLNARGYFSVSTHISGPAIQSTIRLGTRKLDFTHRILGRLVDETGAPLVNCMLSASISENDAQYTTNVVTDTNGGFTLAAVPALWSISCPTASQFPSLERIFGKYLVEVEVEHLEKQTTLVVPTTTSTISVTTSNLSPAYAVVLTAHAHGTTYRLIRQLWDYGLETNQFQVFNGVWTVGLTNGWGGGRTVTPIVNLRDAPKPVSVVVTNGITTVFLGRIPEPEVPRQVQSVRVITASGQVFTNVFVSSDTDYYPVLPSMHPPGATNTPGVYKLLLPTGRWQVYARTWTGFYSNEWDVSREVIIATNTTPPEVTLIFPDPEVGPRIHGTVRWTGGAGVASHHVYLRRSESGTNYTYFTRTDSLGCFSTHVLPGRYLVEAYFQNQSHSSTIVVSNQDAEVNFDLFVPVTPTPMPVTVGLLDEDGSPQQNSELQLSSGFDYVRTNVSTGAQLLLRPGIWQASISLYSTYATSTPTYSLIPSVRWQITPGASTNLTLASVRTPSRIEGRLRDEQGRLLQSGYATAWASMNGRNFWTYASIASGYFSLNVFPGDWQVGASVSSYPAVGPGDRAMPGNPYEPEWEPTLPTNYYTIPPKRWVRVSNDLVRCEFVTTNITIPAPIPLTITVVREDRGETHGIEVYAYNLPIVPQTSRTDETGNASLTAQPGRLTVHTGLPYEIVVFEPLIWPTLSLEVAAPATDAVLVVRQPTGYLSGQLQNVPALGLLPYVFARTQIDGTNYSVTAVPDNTGHYRLPVFPGEWTVEVDDMINDYGIRSVPTRTITVPSTGGPAPVDFVLEPMTGDFRQGRFLTPVLRPNGTMVWEFRAAGNYAWRVDRSDDLIHWHPVDLQSTPNGSFTLETPFTPSARPAFYRATWVQ